MDLQETLEKARQELEQLPFITSTTSHITTDIAEIKLTITNPTDYESFTKYLNRRPTQISIIKTQKIDNEEYQITITPRARKHKEKEKQLIYYLNDLAHSAQNYFMQHKPKKHHNKIKH